MAVEERVVTISVPANADLSAAQYKGVIVNSSGNVAVVAEGQAATGILQDNPAASGRAANVGIQGVSKVLCGGTITLGARFCFDLNGAAVALGSGDDWSMGIMMEAGASGTISKCLIQPTGTHSLGGSNTP